MKIGTFHDMLVTIGTSHDMPVTMGTSHDMPVKIGTSHDMPVRIGTSHDSLGPHSMSSLSGLDINDITPPFHDTAGIMDPWQEQKDM